MGIILLKHKKVGEPSQLELGKYLDYTLEIRLFCFFVTL